jgi:alkylation response protein AidB-like acyl-CoA dehydrogenase
MTDIPISRLHEAFLLFDWLRLDTLLARDRFADHDRASVQAVLDLAHRLAADAFLPHYKKADAEEPRLVDGRVRVHPEVRDGVRAFCAAGFTAGPFDAALGGQQLPELVHAAVMAAFMSANLATTAYPMLAIANARLIAAFGSPAQIERFAKPQIRGDALGTMCMSEPECGSSLSDITTRAEPESEDDCGPRYRITGRKMWISAADHDNTPDIVHLVLAKIPGPDGRLPAGTQGISLFIVPNRLESGAANDVLVAGLNHKMGYRGTVNCLLNFGEGLAAEPEGRAGAIGWRIGEPGRGLAQMFHMMNEARIAIGLGAAAVACRAHRLSASYASERRQGRLPGQQAGRQTPIIHHPDVKRMLLAQKTYAEGALALVLACAALCDEANSVDAAEKREQAEAILGLLTPVAKTWPSEWGGTACDLAIQIHGGYGYTRDFDVEQLYRDNRLNPIHEGTTGVQAIDLVGRKIRKDSAKTLALLRERVRATCAAAGELQRQSRAVSEAWDAICEAAAHIIAAPDGEALWHATDFQSAFGHAVVGWIWLDQCNALTRIGTPKSDALLQSKLVCCRFFCEQEIPKVHLWLDRVTSGSDVAAACPDVALMV